MPRNERRESAPASAPPRTSTPSTLASLSSAANGTLSLAREAVMASVAPDHRRSESLRILTDLAPTLMQSKYTSAAGRSSSAQPVGAGSFSGVGVGTVAARRTRVPRQSLLHRLPGASRPVVPQTSTAFAILENAETLSRLSLDVIPPAGADAAALTAAEVSLIRGFRATIPSSELSKARRRHVRGEITDADLLGDEKLGLKRLGDRARGLLTEGEAQSDHEHENGGDQHPGRKSRRRKKKRDARESFGPGAKLHLEDLLRQADEIAQDKENLSIRQSLIHAEMFEVAQKIDALEEIRRRLEQSLLKLQEENLELDDELEGVQELMASPLVTSAAGTKALPSSVAPPSKSSRRRKGPAFLPSEHDELPSGVAFMTLEGHQGPITALDFDEPYGMLVTAGQDDIVKVWDLCDGEPIGELRGHHGAVKAVQVEDTLCLTGGSDGAVRLWDLRLVEDYEDKLQRQAAQATRQPALDRIAERNEATDEDEALGCAADESGSPCVRTLEGHSKSVTALYYEDSTLVTGSSDKTIRQWDVTTGQCVQVMDLLWAISNPPVVPSTPKKSSNKAQPPRLRHRSSTSFGSVQYDDLLPTLSSPPATLLPAEPPSTASLLSGQFAVPTPPYADGTWDMYQDFVGAVQFWGYALASGSGDGAVRMWDMRTGQAHRTLTGHTAPVTSLQFDEQYIVSGSLDKTIRIWDMRMGAVAELHRYEHPVTAVQFDSRKVVACVGENGIEVYNRTTLAHTRMVVNGHTKPAERMRFIDKYLVSGGRDGCAKVWAM